MHVPRRSGVTAHVAQREVAKADPGGVLLATAPPAVGARKREGREKERGLVGARSGHARWRAQRDALHFDARHACGVVLPVVVLGEVNEADLHVRGGRGGRRRGYCECDALGLFIRLGRAILVETHLLVEDVLHPRRFRRGVRLDL